MTSIDTLNNASDEALVNAAVGGEERAWQILFQRHEAYVYNLAWKFTGDPEDAKDLAQDALMKVLTKLPTFKGQSALRSWMYTIVFNEFLQTKRRPMEDRWQSFEHFADELNSIPSPELSAEEEEQFIFRTKTARTRCMSGMLMCLTREQRLLYLLGDVFQVDHNLGAEIFDLTPANYRQKLARTRKEFHAFMNRQCGLVNSDNPCRCSKKAKAMEAAGRMQTNARLFDPSFMTQIEQYAETVADTVADVIDRKYVDFFRQHPAKKPADKEAVMTQLVNDHRYHNFFNEFKEL